MNVPRFPMRIGLNLLDASDRPGAPPWRSFAARPIQKYDAPDGNQTAVLLRENDAIGGHGVSQLFGSALGGSVYRFNCYCKADTRGWISLALWDHGDGQSGARAWFNLRSGTVGTARLIGKGAARLHCQMEDVGDGWFLCQLSCQVSLSASTGMFIAQIQLANADAGTEYAGDDVSGALIWGPSVQHLLSTNLLRNPTTIGAAPWTLVNAATLDGFPLVPSEPTSILLRESATTGVHMARQLVPRCAGGLSYAFSCIGKAAGRNWLRLALQDENAPGGGMEAWFNLARGTRGSVGRLDDGGTAATSTIDALEDGWYRCILTGPWLPTVVGANCMAQIALGRGDGKGHYAGDGAAGARIKNVSLRTNARPG